jgi:hypothetical protein
MEHIKSSFYFTSKNDLWQVDYIYKKLGPYSNTYLTANVLLNQEIYWEFTSLPNTRTDNPSKTQAKEIISAARKLYKEKYKIRDDRDNKLKKLGI